ncbi:hypothetical protein AJ85_07955 [Alkalihalobacillus alcalophilus ATCC 27647 = CGMCC 1.3604]|uniref:DUF418 domain-containing protein n=1 Tax=Alkalihalobacillus alcalophilus ATCC 27647 = CGMCC 1.3604 TaxID=1218173 RepID=A0A094WJ29_ALKAL|nr:DUF418 domain-containing protein [Alkalihalobacillus alcalophilus]KGA95963.1 hypothetical protein BALCAV_0219145 [Alkalihalobacillus alcalophilus ATCC 27647 = CGMCC 1.3604]MED1563432.1 DUF418 domain-containing protein [Alkalihalobacillus alcalophilus]THG90949.1 hypothetical protein AJ85_07955 [Alkalihalobacillus alcalophilus ATCC 27647 = CGMCC 1.3604]
MKTSTLSPLEGGRIMQLDMMRGLAIFGILLVNIMNFQYGLLLQPDIHQFYPLGAIDRVTEGFLYLFVKTSFYTLFSFLFGYGMVLLQERTELKGTNFTGMYWRRAFLLLVLGILHRTYIWEGDILFTYALTSFVFFFFLYFKGKGLLISALIFLGIMGLSVLGANIDDTAASEYQDGIIYDYSVAEKEVLENGSYLDVLQFRFAADITGLGLIGDIILEITTVLTVIGMFLLGAYVARKKWLLQIQEKKSFFKKIWFVTLIIGFGAKLPYVLSSSYFSEALMTYIGGPFTAIFYATSIALIASTEKGKKLLTPLTYVGRLSLTNYLLQSIIFTTLFYGYGVGLFGQLGFFVGTLIAIAFFIIQIVISKLWLTYFVIGPVEWFWRAGTYFIIPKLKKRP